MITKNDLTEFIICDIVAWNGIIAQYGSVKGHLMPDDFVRYGLYRC